MPATLQIVNGFPGPALTRHMLDEYLALAHRKAGSALWLAPSELAASEIRREIAASGKSIILPNIVSLAQFARQLLASDSTTHAFRRRLILEQVTRDLHQKGKLEYFSRVIETRGFHEGAARMLEEFELAAARPPGVRKATKGKSSAKLIECAAIFEAFDKKLQDRSSLSDIVAQLGPSLPPRFANVEAIFLDGFCSFHEAEWRFLEWLTSKVSSLHVSLPEVSVDQGDVAKSLAVTREDLDQRLGPVARSQLANSRESPAGLTHLLENLFAEKKSADATGISIIEAPGEVGEARLVARRIRALIAEGTSPDAIVVTARDLTHSFDLLEEVFAEYGLPTDVARVEPLGHVPAVRTLLQALRLQEEDFPFAGVTALLRSTYFRPDWKESPGEMPLKAEGLLRLLGQPRGRDAYLRSVESWRISPPQALEDEQAEDSIRKRKTFLATECQPFIARFFKAWDAFPSSATPERMVEFARGLCDDLGITTTAHEDGRDRDALEAFWTALIPRGKQKISRQAFLHMAGVAASTETQACWTGTPGRVRMVPAEEARHLWCDHLFVIGLGEGSFPQLSLPGSLLDDGDRQRFRQHGIALADSSTRLGEEQLLFLQLVGQPRKELILSYPALDDKGQPLLPGSFLRAVQACFTPGAIVPLKQSMLIEGYMERPPLSAAESRVQFAFANSRGRSPNWYSGVLPAELCEQLRWSAAMANERFRTDEFGRFDGWVDRPAIVEYVQERFGSKRVFSPTALETYVACPFRFMMEHVLKLSDLEEPSEEVEQTRRGSAYHRALSRLHKHLNEVDPQMAQSVLPDTVGTRLGEEIDVAVGEYANRAPSAASHKLWLLEGKRLQRSVPRYQQHWDEFLEPLRKQKAAPSPLHLEADFGFPPADSETKSYPSLTISVGDVEVQLGGRIDRVDVAELEGELGFWIIDYKTGRAQNYTGSGLVKMEKLQLSLYAIAVEKVFYPGQKARPLGLAYWLVTDTGPKQVLPKKFDWFDNPEKWPQFRTQLEEWVAKLVGRIRLAQFPLSPRSEHCTDTCSFAQMCRISQSRAVGKKFDLRLPGEEERQEELSSALAKPTK